jgi:hypothetical protein
MIGVVENQFSIRVIPNRRFLQSALFKFGKGGFCFNLLSGPVEFFGQGK